LDIVVANVSALAIPSDEANWRASFEVDQLNENFRAVIDELKPDGPKAFGAVMKAATSRLAGRAEGAQVAAAARKLLAS